MSGTHPTNTVVWLGPAGSERTLGWTSSTLQLHAYATSNDALADARVLLPEAVLVAADWIGATMTIQDVLRANLGVPIIAVTNRPVPLSLMNAVAAGASQILGTQGGEGLAERVEAIVQQAHQRDRENALLRELSVLTRGFLKTLIALERRNLMLSETLAGNRGSDEPYPSSVLVIDDEPGVCRLFDVLLGDSFDVHLVHSGEDGLRAMATAPFPVVILDKNLPGMNGLEVLRAVKRDYPATSVIMITGYSSEQAAIDAINAGASAYLQKPFDDVHLVQKTVVDVFEQSRKHAQNVRHLQIIKQRNSEFLADYQRIEGELDRLLAARNVAPLTSEEGGA